MDVHTERQVGSVLYPFHGRQGDLRFLADKPYFQIDRILFVVQIRAEQELSGCGDLWHQDLNRKEVFNVNFERV